MDILGFTIRAIRDPQVLVLVLGGVPIGCVTLTIDALHVSIDKVYTCNATCLYWVLTITTILTCGLPVMAVVRGT